MPNRQRNGILIIDNNVNDCIRQRDIVRAKLSPEIDYQFHFSHSIDDGIALLRTNESLRMSLCSIFIDQSLTAAHNPEIDTYHKNKLRDLEETIVRVKHPDTVLCFYGDDASAQEAHQELKRAQMYAPGRSPIPTQIINSSQPWHADAMAQIITNANALSQSGLAGRVDDLSHQLRELQNTLSQGTQSNPSYLERVSLNEQAIAGLSDRFVELASKVSVRLDRFGEVLEEIGERLTELKDGRTIQLKLIDALLSGSWGLALMAVIGVVLALLLGVDLWPAILELIDAIN